MKLNYLAIVILVFLGLIIAYAVAQQTKPPTVVDVNGNLKIISKTPSLPPAPTASPNAPAPAPVPAVTPSRIKPTAGGKTLPNPPAAATPTSSTNAAPTEPTNVPEQQNSPVPPPPTKAHLPPATVVSPGSLSPTPNPNPVAPVRSTGTTATPY